MAKKNVAAAAPAKKAPAKPKQAGARGKQTLVNAAKLAIRYKAGRGGKEVPVTAAPPAERDGNRYGVSTGLRITNFVNELLLANERAQLGDGELQQQLAAEFPNRPSLQAMSAWRSYFNKGLHGHGHLGKQVGCYGRSEPETKELVRKNPEFQAKRAASVAAGPKAKPTKKAAKKPAKKPAKKAPAKKAAAKK